MKNIYIVVIALCFGFLPSWLLAIDNMVMFLLAGIVVVPASIYLVANVLFGLED